MTCGRKNHISQKLQSCVHLSFLCMSLFSTCFLMDADFKFQEVLVSEGSELSLGFWLYCYSITDGVIMPPSGCHPEQVCRWSGVSGNGTCMTGGGDLSWFHLQFEHSVPPLTCVTSHGNLIWRRITIILSCGFHGGVDLKPDAVWNVLAQFLPLRH